METLLPKITEWQAAVPDGKLLVMTAPSPRGGNVVISHIEPLDGGFLHLTIDTMDGAPEAILIHQSQLQLHLAYVETRPLPANW